MWVYLLAVSLLVCATCAVIYANRPSYDFPISGDKTEEEIALEKSGNLNAIQRYRYRLYRNTRNPSSALIYNILSTEEELRYIVQRGEDIEGDKIHRNIYMLTMEYWKYRGEFTGVLGRELDLWRSNPSWYMHRVLVADWVAKQGCCSRGCGCCAKRQIEFKQSKFKQNNFCRKLGMGHCTLRCGCCRKACVFQLSEEERTEICDWLNHTDPERRSFYLQLELASIWGLESDNYDNPFHLIEGCDDVRDNESTTTEGSWMDTALV